MYSAEPKPSEETDLTFTDYESLSKWVGSVILVTRLNIYIKNNHILHRPWSDNKLNKNLILVCVLKNI